MRHLLFALLVLAASAASAQQPVFTALPVLEIPAVPELGGAAVARSLDDPRMGLQNPALLGLSAASLLHATTGTPAAAWFGEQSTSVAATSIGFEAGALDVGASLAQSTMGTDARTLADGTPYDPIDRYRALGVGAATRGHVRLALGAATRYVTTTDAPRWTGESFQVGRLRGVTADIGVAVSVDVAEIALLPPVRGLVPALEVTAGYAQQHLGGTIRYAGYESQSLPRLATLGWSAVGGLDGLVSGVTLRVVEVEVAAQADHSLVYAANGGTAYSAFTGGLSPLDAIRGSGDATTTGRRGVRIALGETLALSRGRFDGWGYNDAQTYSIEMRTAGLFTLLGSLDPESPLADLSRIDLRVGRTTIWAGTPNEVTRSSVSLVLGR